MGSANARTQQEGARGASNTAGLREFATAAAGFAALAVLFTYPLAFRLGSVGRVDNGDGQFSIWNIAWVARALVLDPRHVLDANIFYPHRGTLTYSETNLGAGALAIPVYWTTKNPYAAHNFVLLLSFVLSGIGMYYLVRHLTGDRRAAAIAAMLFAFCPYVLTHTPHIQLMMTAGLPFGLLAVHRLFDRPSPGRGAALGGVMAAQTYFCGYYAVFLMLIVAFAMLFFVALGRRWRDARMWLAIGVAAVVAIAGAVPLVAAYARQQRATGFARSLQSAREFSASLRDYFASPSYAHAPLLRLVGHGATDDMLFPGFLAIAFGLVGVIAAWRSSGTRRETAGLYIAMALASFWLSFGPAGGLYGALYAIVPGFTLMRAPSRFGLLVVFSVCVLAGIGLARLFSKKRTPAAVLFVGVAAIAELLAPFEFPPVPPVARAYQVLAALPYGPVLELPVYSRPYGFLREGYMLSSTVHWMPLIDAYSDYIPDDFTANMDALGDFPSRDSFSVLESIGGRYAVFHVEAYNAAARAELLDRLKEFAPYLQRRSIDDGVWLYEITRFPPR